MALRNGLAIKWVAPHRLARMMRIVVACVTPVFATPLFAQRSPDNTCMTMGAGTEKLCATQRGAIHSILITDIPSQRTTGFTVYAPRGDSKDAFNLIDTMPSELEPTKSAEERASAMQRLTDQASTQDYGEERFGECTLTLSFRSNGIGFKATRH